MTKQEQKPFIEAKVLFIHSNYGKNENKCKGTYFHVSLVTSFMKRGSEGTLMHL